jgi:hypothetical protein
LPALVGLFFLLSAVLNDPTVVETVSLEQLSSVTSMLGVELPEGYGLLPSFPSLGLSLPIGGIISGAGALVSYVVYIIIAKLKTNTVSANFYSEVKDEYEVIN